MSLHSFVTEFLLSFMVSKTKHHRGVPLYIVTPNEISGVPGAEPQGRRHEGMWFIDTSSYLRGDVQVICSTKF